MKSQYKPNYKTPDGQDALGLDDLCTPIKCRQSTPYNRAQMQSQIKPFSLFAEEPVPDNISRHSVGSSMSLLEERMRLQSLIASDQSLLRKYELDQAIDFQKNIDRVDALVHKAMKLMDHCMTLKKSKCDVCSSIEVLMQNGYEPDTKENW